MIEFAGVSKRFGAQPVLDGLTFTARDGAVTGFVGPNGAGKSTAFKILLGLLDADAGAARVDGADYRRHPQPGQALGVFLGPQWIPGGMTGRAYLRYTADLLGARRSTIDEYLEVVGLAGSAAKTVRGYSLGMRQRLGIAAALVGEPTNLVLDEPVNGLDVEGVRWLRDHLRFVADSGRCVLLSSHLMSELELVADDVVMLGAGRAVRTGGIDELRRSDTTAVLIRSDDNESLVRHLRELGVAVERSGDAIRVADASVNWVATVVGPLGISLHSVAREVNRLEDVYMDQVQRDAAEAAR